MNRLRLRLGPEGEFANLETMSLAHGRLGTLENVVLKIGVIREWRQRTIEMAGAFVCAALGIAPSVRHADYIGSWLQIIREDNRAILRAASAASKAADYILACRDTASTDLDVAGEDEADGFELEGRLAA